MLQRSMQGSPRREPARLCPGQPGASQPARAVTGVEARSESPERRRICSHYV